MGGPRNGGQRLEGHVEGGPRPAPVDEGRGPDDVAPRFARHRDGLAGRAAGGDDVLDDEDPLGGGEREAPAQRQPAVAPFGEDGPDAERAGHLVSDDHAAEGRGQDHARRQRTHPRRHRRAERRGPRRVLEHQRALQVARAVQAGRELEMPLQQGAGVPEALQQVVGMHGIAPDRGKYTEALW